jgi:hypothetical protein
MKGTDVIRTRALQPAAAACGCDSRHAVEISTVRSAGAVVKWGPFEIRSRRPGGWG